MSGLPLNEENTQTADANSDNRDNRTEENTQDNQ